MESVRTADTLAERLLRSKLHRMGLRYRKNVRTVLGRPDIVFPKQRVAVFVDGDYWHGRILQQSGIEALNASLKTSNREFWVRKIQQNVARDFKVCRELARAGWLVVRVWEKDVRKDPDVVAKRVFKVVNARKERNIEGKTRPKPAGKESD